MKAKTRMVVIGPRKGKHIFVILVFFQHESLSNFKGSCQLRGGKVDVGRRKEVAVVCGQEQEWKTEAMGVNLGVEMRVD